jgi:DNA-binding transcriptional MocR family regulator
VTGTADPVDATVVLLADPGDRILTSDPADLTVLALAAAYRAVIIAC